MNHRAWDQLPLTGIGVSDVAEMPFVGIKADRERPRALLLLGDRLFLLPPDELAALIDALLVARSQLDAFLDEGNLE